MNKFFEIARENIIKCKESSKHYYDRSTKQHIFKIGDFVYVRNNAGKPGVSKKLSPNYKGPYKIIKVNKNQTIKVLLNNNKSAVYHHNLLKPVFSDEPNNGDSISNPSY